MKKMKKKLGEPHEFQLPKSCRQPRSAGTKPRTNFTESVWSSSGSGLEFLIYNHMSIATTARMSQETYYRALGYDNQMHKLSPNHCVSEDEGDKLPFTISLDSQAEVGSVSRETFLGTKKLGLKSRDDDENFNVDFSSKTFGSTLLKDSHGTISKNVNQVALGTMACAKITQDGGWPSEALDKDGPINSFLDGDKPRYMPMTPVQVHESSVVASRNASCSSRSEDDNCEKGRGKRKRKPKVHFDETSSAKSGKNTRRLKIMRQLGLIAPPGSPYAVASHIELDILLLPNIN